jgi:hypothetical protein
LPLRLPAKRRGRRLEHTPDLLSRHDDGTIRIVGRPTRRRQDEDFTLKVRLTPTPAPTSGWSTRSSRLVAGWRVNLMWIHAYRRPMPWYPGSLRLIREYLEGDGTIADVLGSTPAEGTSCRRCGTASGAGRSTATSTPRSRRRPGSWCTSLRRAA